MGIAHRGATDTFKENTMQAFSAAYELGFRNFELDVHVSRDRHVFVCHDNNLERIIGERLFLSKLSSSEIRALENSHGYKIPTLLEVLEEFPDVQLNIDAKSWKSVFPLCEVIKNTSCYHRICIGGFNDLRVYKIISNLKLPVCFSLGPLGSIYFYISFIFNKKRVFNAGCLQVPDIFLGKKIVTKEFVKFAHQCGLKVHVWTINDELKMRNLVELGVDGIMTDNCVGLKKVMKEYDLWHL